MRPLHFVFKVSNREKTMHFYKNVLGMKVLRHEEFNEGCKASCNGYLKIVFFICSPYDNKWSKTMIGYGPEDSHFVMEITYNYGICEYKMGNDFQYISIDNKEAYSAIIGGLWPITSNTGDIVEILSPDGYVFCVSNKTCSGDPVRQVVLASSNLELSRVVEYNESQLTLCCSREQCQLKLVKVNDKIDHASAYGRIAFACLRSQLLHLQDVMDKYKQTVLTRLVCLETPGKAAVEVIILADPDGHEICFVGDEAFGELSQVDPNATALLEEAMKLDQSDEWFNKRGGKQIK